MTNSYSIMASKLQSRIAKRANDITKEGHWKQSYHALQQMESFRQSKLIIKELGDQQALDKRLLGVINELAYIESLDNPVTYFAKML